MDMQNQVVEALQTPEAYEEDPGKIEIIQTHISFIFLAGNFVYKVKKAVNFGFLDFTTLEKRRFFCEKELHLNRRLCPDLYLEVVPINKSEAIKIKGKGETVEYALKMKRVPQEAIMTTQLKEGRINDKTIDQIAKVIAHFHLKAQTSPEINRYGSLEIIRTNWDENFQQTQKYIGKTISEKDFRLTQTRINRFTEQKNALFQKRINDNRVRDCHGDIHSGNIFITDKVYIFDAIEFNDRFRYSDVASDVAFLAMDLDFQGRTDLADYFVKKYMQYSGDQELKLLLPFYKCYRAYVRGKVISFKLDDPNVKPEEKQAATEEAQEYFKLAAKYTEKL